MKPWTTWALAAGTLVLAVACGDETVVAGGALADVTASSDGAVAGDLGAQADAIGADAAAPDVVADVPLFPDVAPVDLGPVDIAVADGAADSAGDAPTDVPAELPPPDDADVAPPPDVAAETTADVLEELPQDTGPPDVDPVDATTEVGPDAAADVPPDAVAELPDPSDVADSAPPVDAAAETVVDSEPGDVAPDATPNDAAEDIAVADAPDAAADAGAEITADATIDAAADASPEVGPDAAADTGADVPPPECVADIDCAGKGATASCHQWQCKSGSCLQTPMTDGLVCSDGSLCSAAAACSAGKCVQVKPKSCDDGNACTADACDNATGACANKPAVGFCDDGNACTQGDSCKDGACGAGTSKVCDDNNPCTADACDAKTGNCTAPAQNSPCDDNDKCTDGDSCANGACKSGKLVACNDGNACTDETCDSAKGCVSLPNTATCADALACVLGACKDGKCAPGGSTGCEDNNPCTKDTCEPGKGCIYTPIADGTVCAKGTLCAASGTCVKGTCAPGAKTDCNDGNACTDDSCDPAVGCKWVPNKSPCEDGNQCTVKDTCGNGKCVTGVPMDVKVACDDKNVCTDEGCDAAKGCTHVPKAGTCDDASPCTTGETCANGACGGGKPTLCDDGKQCTQDNCDAKTGDCSWTGKAGPCEDGNFCTKGDACQGATCLPGAPTVCTDAEPCTEDGCDPKTGCVYKAAPGADAKACDGVTSGGACFKVVAANLNWAQAEAACVTWGGHLARIDSATENTVVRSAANTVCGNGATPFIGINDVQTEGKWVWPDGAPVTYTNWQGGEPNNCTGCCSIANAGEDVGQMLASGTWNDLCSATAQGCYVCRRPIPTVKCGDPSKCTAGGTCVAAKCTGASTSCDDGNSCTADVCNAANQGCTMNQLADGTKCGIGVCGGGKCTPGVDLANPATSCASIPTSPTPTDGLYWIDPDGKTGPVAPVQTACVFGYGGGWALVAIAADDSQNTWTWDARALWTTNTAVFGSPSVGNKDFKSALLHTLPFKEVLFVHAPSLVWAAYGAVGDGKQSLAAKINSYGAAAVCWNPGQGFKMTAGSLVSSGALCETALYFNMNDHDGNAACGDDDQSWGPGWNTYTNAKCPFDDPGITGGLGPAASSAGNEAVNCGFGQVLGLNKGQAGTGQNRMMVFVR